VAVAIARQIPLLHSSIHHNGGTIVRGHITFDIGGALTTTGDATVH